MIGIDTIVIGVLVTFLIAAIGFLVGIAVAESGTNKTWEKRLVHKGFGTYDENGDFEFLYEDDE